jgi:hypothetical protein
MSVLPILSSTMGLLDKNLNIFNKITGRSERNDLRQMRDLQNMQMQNDLRLAQARQQVELEQSAQTEAARRDALRRAVARQRASFGAQGVGSSGGSADAVLLGLFDESEEQKAERQRLDDLRNYASQTESYGKKSMNLLKATQAAEKKKFESFF